MGRPFRPDYSWIYPWVIPVLLCLPFASLGYRYEVARQSCERRGGTYLYNVGACLAKGMVLQ